MTGALKWRSQGVAAAGGRGEEGPGVVAAVLTGQRWN